MPPPTHDGYVLITAHRTLHLHLHAHVHASITSTATPTHVPVGDTYTPPTRRSQPEWHAQHVSTPRQLSYTVSAHPILARTPLRMVPNRRTRDTASSRPTSHLSTSSTQHAIRVSRAALTRGIARPRSPGCARPCSRTPRRQGKRWPPASQSRYTGGRSAYRRSTSRRAA